MKKEIIIRTAILVLALINNALTLFGKSPIPIDDETLSALLSLIITTAAAVWAWWKNNSFTKHAIKADEYLEELRKSEGN